MSHNLRINLVLWLLCGVSKSNKKVLKLNSIRMDWHDLPELALIQVLNYLPVRDQLNARLVCRYWKLISDDSVRKDELILFLEIYPRPVYWFHDGRKIDLGDAFLITHIHSLKSEFFLKHFRKVRRLMIVHAVNTPSDKFIE